MSCFTPEQKSAISNAIVFNNIDLQKMMEECSSLLSEQDYMQLEPIFDELDQNSVIFEVSSLSDLMADYQGFFIVEKQDDAQIAGGQMVFIKNQSLALVEDTKSLEMKSKMPLMIREKEQEAHELGLLLFEKIKSTNELNIKPGNRPE